MDFKAPFEDKATIERLCKAAPQPTAFCEFGERLGMPKRRMEGEVMTWQTLHGIKKNIESGNGAFSFKGDGVHAFQNGGVVDNGTAFGFLVGQGYFLLKEVPEADVPTPPSDVKPHDGKYTVIQMSGTLVALIEQHLKA